MPIAPEVVSKFNRRPVCITLTCATAEASLTNAVIDVYKADFKFKMISVEAGARTVTGASSFNLYNITDAALVIAATTPLAGDSLTVNTFSSVAQTTIQKGDKIQLRVTTPAGGLITNLTVNILVEVLDAPTNAVNEA